jgi:uncharacterized protein (TIGR02611 family)
MPAKQVVPTAPRTVDGMFNDAPPHGLRGRVHATLEAIRANPTGRIALKVFIGVFGGLVVALGIALIPLPGPGWAIVILGLAIWAVEFVWAKHLLSFTRRHVRNWTHWITAQTLAIRCLVGGLGLLFIAGVVWASLKFSVGIDLVVICRDFLAAR